MTVILTGRYLLAGVDSGNHLTLAKFAASYAGTEGLKILNGTLIGVGKDSAGNEVLLKLSSTGELVS